MILDVLVKATLVLGVAALFSLGTRGRAAAATRHAVWVAALVGAVLVPVFSAVLPALRVPLLPAELRAAAVPQPASRPALPAEPAQTDLAADQESHAAAPARTASAPAAYPDAAPASAVLEDTRALLRTMRDFVDGVPAIAALWLVGAIALLSRIVLSRLSVARVTRTRVPGRAPWLPFARRLARIMRVPRRLRFLRSDRVAMPMACGVLRPAVVLPADADAWSADRLRAVLLHELAHVRRRDCLTQVTADVALAILWFHPLAWVARRAVRRERERACDDLVLAAGTPAPEYASHLLDVARDARHRTASLTLAGGVAMARPSELEGRLMAILDDTRPRRALTLRTCAVVGLISCGVVAPMSALDLWQAPGMTAQAVPDSPIGRPRPAPRATAVPMAAPEAVAPSARREASEAIDTAQEQAPTPEPAPTPTPMPSSPRAPRVAVTPAVAQTPAPVQQPQPVVAPAPPTPVGQGPKGKPPVGGPKKVDVGRKQTPPDPRVVAALTEALKDSDQEVRQQALHTLSRFRDPSTVDALIGALTHSDPEMRRQAANALSHIRDPRAQKALAGALSDKDVEVRRQALFALARLGDPAAFEPLTLALKDSDPEVRQQAAFSLGQMREARAVPVLGAAIGDANSDVRQAVVHALGQLRSPESVTPLLTALKDSDAEIRQQAAFALGQIRDPRAIDALMVAAKDQDKEVRTQAYFALGQVGDARAQDLAIAGLKDPDPEVRRMAAHALARIASRDE